MPAAGGGGAFQGWFRTAFGDENEEQGEDDTRQRGARKAERTGARSRKMLGENFLLQMVGRTANALAGR